MSNTDWILRVEDLRSRYEASSLGAVRAALSDQVRRSIRAIRDAGTLDFDGSVFLGAAENVVRDVYPAAFQDSRDFWGRPGKDVPEWLMELMLQYIESSVYLRVRVVNDTTRRMIAEALQDGLQAGKDTWTIADELTDRWLVENPSDGPITMDRSMTIARTEIAASQSAASFIGARDAGMTHKAWHSARDARTRGPGRPNNSRFDHYAAHRQVVPIGSPFDISGEQLMYPGDVSLGASAGNVINCRCAMTFEYRENNYG